MKQRITLSLNEELCTLMRVEAAKKNKRPNYIVEQALMQYLGTGKKSPRAKKSTSPSPAFGPPSSEPIEPEPTDLTMSPEEQEEWANALVMMTVGE